MIVQHNISAMNANRQLGITNGNLSKSTEKLSSGYRINRAADDAAGLAISEKMRGQIRGLNQASSNAEDGISLIQTAEGALQESQNILQRMRELAVQAATGTTTDDDKAQIQEEINSLTQEVDRIATTSEFNTKKLLDGSQKGSSSYRAGIAKSEGTFKNSNVGVLQMDTSAASLTGKNDVIRIEFQRDISAGTAAGGIAIGTLSAAKTNNAIKATITTLNGISASVSISIDANGDATVTVQNAAFDKRVVSSGAQPTQSMTFKISGAKNIMAGDVVTISLGKMEETKAAEVGKESLRLQVGANAGQEIELSIGSMKAKDLGIIQTSTSVNAATSTGANMMGKALDVTNQANASLAIEAYDKALTKVSTERARMGAVQNRLEHTISNLDTSEENLQAAESRIRDVDMAEEMTTYSKSNILMQAGQSMLAQANQSNQGVLSLLG